MDDLNALRRQIDAVDKEIYQLFAERMRISARIAAVKRRTAADVRDPDREQQKEDGAAAAVPPGLAPYARQLYRALAACSRNYQEEISKKEAAPCPTASSGKA